MIKIILIYFIAVFINPIFIIILAILFLPKVFQESICGILIQTAIAGFTSIWLGKTIFSLLELQPDSLIVFLIGIVFAVNYLLVYDFKDNGPILYNATALGAVGSISGVLTGGLYFF